MCRDRYSGVGNSCGSTKVVNVSANFRPSCIHCTSKPVNHVRLFFNHGINGGVLRGVCCIELCELVTNILVLLSMFRSDMLVIVGSSIVANLFLRGYIAIVMVCMTRV